MLDFIWDTFGEDYIVYAGQNKAALDILRAYFMGKSRTAAEKYLLEELSTGVQMGKERFRSTAADLSCVVGLHSI